MNSITVFVSQLKTYMYIHQKGNLIYNHIYNINDLLCFIQLGKQSITDVAWLWNKLKIADMLHKCVTTFSLNSCFVDV